MAIRLKRLIEKNIHEYYKRISADITRKFSKVTYFRVSSDEQEKALSRTLTAAQTFVEDWQSRRPRDLGSRPGSGGKQMLVQPSCKDQGLTPAVARLSGASKIEK